MTSQRPSLAGLAYLCPLATTPGHLSKPATCDGPSASARTAADRQTGLISHWTTVLSGSCGDHNSYNRTKVHLNKQITN